MDLLRSLPARMLTVAAAALLVAGCGGTPQLATSQGVVHVTERDFQIKVSPSRIPAGTVVFQDTNQGPDEHELIVARVEMRTLPLRTDGLTVNEEKLQSAIVGTLEPGQPESVRELRVRLRPGHYVLFCNMFGHFLGGMHANVIVQ